jgi:hypothetical protein
MNTAENGKPVTWDFHVATMAYVHEKGWMVIDTHLGKVVSVNEWVQEIGALNTDGLLRFYNTDASKFGLSLGKYSRLQMGLNLPTPEDWYRGYFKDMMSSLKEETSEIQPSAIWQTLNQYTN